MRFKKGQTDMILAGVTTIAMVGFLLVMGLIMMDSLYLETADDNNSTTNETLSTVTETGETVVTASDCGFHSFTVSIITNATDDGTVIDAANYTTNSRTGTVYFVGTDTGYNNTDWNVTYTYSFAENSTACTATNSTIAGMGKFADYIDLIVLAIIITVVITLLFVIFSLKKVR